MPPSSFSRISDALSLENTSLAVPFFRLPPRFHRKANGIYIYKMGTEDEVSIRIPKPPRDGDDFYALAMALTNHKSYHGHFVFVEHDIRTDMAKHAEDDNQMFENIKNLLDRTEIDYRITMQTVEESYQLKAKKLFNNFEATADTGEAIKTFRVAHDSLIAEKESLVAEKKADKDSVVHRLYQALEHVLRHSELNKANYSKEEWHKKSEQDFVKKFEKFGLHPQHIINEKQALALEKKLQRKLVD
jgi:hypothetical protein